MLIQHNKASNHGFAIITSTHDSIFVCYDIVIIMQMIDFVAIVMLLTYHRLLYIDSLSYDGMMRFSCYSL